MWRKLERLLSHNLFYSLFFRKTDKYVYMYIYICVGFSRSRVSGRLYINLLPKRRSRLDVEREREMICTLESDFKIQKSREKWNFKNPMVHTRRSLKRGIYILRDTHKNAERSSSSSSSSSSRRLEEEEKKRGGGGGGVLSQ